MREIVDLAYHRAVVVVETALAGPELAVGMAQVPLADHDGLVACLLEGLRQQPFVGRQTIFAGSWNDQSLQTVAARVAASHQCRSRRGAHRLSVELFEPCSVLRQLVDVRRLDVGAVKSDVFPSEVVRHNVHDVGPWSGLLRHSRCCGHERYWSQSRGGSQERTAAQEEIAPVHSCAVLRHALGSFTKLINHSISPWLMHLLRRSESLHDCRMSRLPHHGGRRGDSGDRECEHVETRWPARSPQNHLARAFARMPRT